MTILDVIILAFVLLELCNITVLYIKPSTKLGNSVGVFNAYSSSQKEAENHLFVKYLIRWIANVKLIFIALLIVILFLGTPTIKLYSCFALVVSISLYYFTLHPIIKKLDNDGCITPKGYSKTLFIMITSFILMFVIGVAVYFI